jgi:hypothetical protein
MVIEMSVWRGIGIEDKQQRQREDEDVKTR